MTLSAAVPSPTFVPVDNQLPLREVRVEASARGGLSRVILRQRFKNEHAEPLTVSYVFPLPEDAAVSGYAFTVGERRIVGEVDRRKAARERFEAALVEGRTAALLEQERTSLFTQEIGNVPPGAEVTAEIVLDQPLRWVDEGSWEWRFPLASAPRYLGVAGRVEDASRVAIAVADGELPVHASLVLEVGDALEGGALAKPSSPSHALSVSAANEVTTGAEGVPLDRDLVVRWAVAAGTPGATLATFAPASATRDESRDESGEDGGYGLLTVVPPRPACKAPRVARDLIVLLDTSGSMGGAPLDRARRVCLALIDTLEADDQLEMIEFSSRPNRWTKSALAATAANKAAARTWLGSLRASGSTEMRAAIDEAMSGLRPAGQRQVILVTDGHIGFESEVVASIVQRLPAASRVHTVGVGSSVNRSLTGGAARAGRGVEVIIGVEEDVERAARRLVARTDAPLVVDVTLSGSALREHAPARLPDLYAGAPLLVGMQLRAGGGELLLRGRTPAGEWTQRLQVSEARDGAKGNAVIPTFFARQKVEDLEMQMSAGGDHATYDALIETVGTRYQISTRLTSWVAISEEVAVDPRESTRRVRVPQNLPHGMSVEGLGLRPAMGMPMLGQAPMGAGFGGAAPRSMGSLDRAEGMAPPMSRARGSIAPGAPPRPAGAPLARPAAAPPAMASRPSTIGRAMKAVGDFLKKGRGDRQVSGRLLSRVYEQLLVELTADDGPLDFILGGATVTVHFTDGSTATATVDLDRSTREGTLAHGASARLALTLPSPNLATITALTLEIAGGTVVIVLS
jgi:Ca-activated chloride channel family protein